MKKVLSAALALMLAAAMATPALATTTGSQEITDPSKLANGVTNKVTGTTSVGTLKITVPTTNAVVLNPYALSVNVTAEGKEDNTSGSAVTDQVISPAQAIKSESTSKVKVSAIVTGTAGGNVKFATASLASDTTTKTNSVFMKLVAAAPDTTGVASDPLAAITEAKSITVATKSSAKTELGTLDEGDTTPQYLQFQLQGDAVKSPTNPWTTRDTVGATIAFSFDLVSGSTGGSSSVSATMSPSTLSLDSSTNSTGTLTVSLSGGVTVTSVSWSSSDTTAATVGSGTSATETVTYVGAGTTTITASITGSDGNTYTATCNVTCS